MRQCKATWEELKPRYQGCTRGKMTGELGYHRCFTARRQEDHDVSRQHDGVKQAPTQRRVRHSQIERREVAFIP